MNIVTRQKLSLIISTGVLLSVLNIHCTWRLLKTNSILCFLSDGSCIFQENGEKQISVEEDTPPGKMTPDKRFTKDCSHLRHVPELWPQNETLMGQS